MSNVDWSAFKGDFVKWVTPGQVIDGEVRDIRLGSFQGKDYPEITVHTKDGNSIVSANQSNLQRQLAEDPPAIGDHIRIEYRGESERAQPGMNPAKLFAYSVTHRGAGVSTSDLV